MAEAPQPGLNRPHFADIREFSRLSAENVSGVYCCYDTNFLTDFIVFRQPYSTKVPPAYTYFLLESMVAFIVNFLSDGYCVTTCPFFFKY